MKSASTDLLTARNRAIVSTRDGDGGACDGTRPAKLRVPVPADLDTASGHQYRPRADGSRAYSVYFRGRYIGVDGGEQEALAKQAELRGKAARGEKPVTRRR